jgi:hypothetical protein
MVNSKRIEHTAFLPNNIDDLYYPSTIHHPLNPIEPLTAFLLEFIFGNQTILTELVQLAD